MERHDDDAGQQNVGSDPVSQATSELEEELWSKHCPVASGKTDNARLIIRRSIMAIQK
jgi:hypothetical protein